MKKSNISIVFLFILGLSSCVSTGDATRQIPRYVGFPEGPAFVILDEVEVIKINESIYLVFVYDPFFPIGMKFNDGRYSDVIIGRFNGPVLVGGSTDPSGKHYYIGNHLPSEFFKLRVGLEDELLLSIYSGK